MGGKLILSERFQPGDLDQIVRLHARYYANNWGFGTYFKEKVASELAAFARRKGPNDLVLIARDDTGVAASIILDLNDPNRDGRGAHLRWFIVSDRYRSTGIGRQMMSQAMAHCDA